MVPLTRFLDERRLGTGALQVAPIGDGHSNLTFALMRGPQEFILRRPPRPPYLPSAHDVIREARVLRALDGRARAPRVLAVCDDAAVIGAPFSVMERVPGVVITDRVPAELPRGSAARIGQELVDLLCELHTLDPAILERAKLGRRGSYVDRLLRRFSALWLENQTRAVPDVDAVGAWLATHRPTEAREAIVHGDFRFGNTTVVDTPELRIAGLLDWEMATIGDPLVDLGYLLATWPDDNAPSTVLTELSAAIGGFGAVTRARALERYCEYFGLSEPPEWYLVFAQWKAAISLEGSRKRFLTGTTTDPFFETFGEAVPRAPASRARMCRPREDGGRSETAGAHAR